MKLFVIGAVMMFPATMQFAADAQEASPDPGQPRAHVAPPRDPAQAAASVKAALRKSAGVPAQEIVVSLHADTLVLSGELGSEEEIARAISTAGKAAGGVRVSSHLKVRPGGQPVQQSVTLVREVEKALREDQRTANLGVAVSIDDGQVIGLHGLVPSRENRQAAEDVAARVTGVKRIRSHLQVPGE